MSNTTLSSAWARLLWAACAVPATAFAQSSTEASKGLLGVGGVSAVIALLLWSASISLCRKGGGWILTGVLLAFFVALPVSGLALASLGLSLF